RESVSVSVNDSDMGSVTINGVTADSAEIVRGQTVTFKAVPKEGYELVCWKDSEGEVVSEAETYSIARLYSGVSLSASFKSSYGDGYTVTLIDGLTEDFEGETNIFGITEKSTFTSDTVSISGSHSIVPTSDRNSASIYGNVLAIGVGSTTKLRAGIDPVTLNERQTAKITLETANGYLSGNKAGYSVAIRDGSDKELVGFDYDSSSCKITAVRIGGSTVTTNTSGETFEAFGFNQDNDIQSRDFTKPIDNIQIEICGNKNVAVTFNHYSKGSLSNTYSYNGTVSDDNISIKSFEIIKSGSNTSSYQRASIVDNIKALLITAPAEETDEPTAEIIDGSMTTMNGTEAYADTTATGFFARVITKNSSVSELGVKVGETDKGTKPITTLTNAEAVFMVIVDGVSEADADKIEVYVR
ncbi:MAG: hypothetical protein ACI4EA_09445, partial [Candidatus Ornithomonoglobus sp.]